MRKSRFTLMEVMVAAVILLMSVVMVTAILGGARARILRAEQRWGREHLLAQAAELYLLAGPDAEVPDSLFPEGFSSSCTLTEPGGLPEEAYQPIDGWILGEFRIAVYDPAGDPVSQIRVRKLVREDDLR